MQEKNMGHICPMGRSRVNKKMLKISEQSIVAKTSILKYKFRLA